MFVPIILACIVAVFGRHHPGVISHGHHHHQSSETLQTDSISPLIVGGSETQPEKWPWQASLTLGSNGFMFCGGSIIRPGSNYYVLTAAHCVDGDSPGDLVVNFGQRLYNHQDDSGVQRVGVSGITMHANYNRRTLENDVALLELSTPPDVSSNKIAAVTLPSSTDQLTSGDLVTVTGFGTTSSGGEPSQFLMMVEKPYVADAQCSAAYGRDFYPNSMLCAGEVNKDACQGDSGGPLVYANDTSSPDNFKQYGVVSWGIGCGHPDYPGVYAKVTSYLQWIDDNTV